MGTEYVATSPWEHNFRQHVKLRRELLEMTQTDLAKQMKRRGFAFHQQTIQRIESGDRPIRLDEAFMLAEILQSRLSTMTSSPDAGLGDLVYAIDRLRRESVSMDEGVKELFFDDWFDHFEHLTVAFYEIFEQAGRTATPEVRVAAAWVIKAMYVIESLDELLVHLTGLHSEEGDWRSPILTRDISSSLEWLTDDNADAWKGLAFEELPSQLSLQDPEELSRYIDEAFIKKIKDAADGEHQEAP